MMNGQQYAASVRKRIARAGKSVGDLISATGLAKSTLSRMAKGETSPNLLTIGRIEEALKRWGV